MSEERTITVTLTREQAACLMSYARAGAALSPPADAQTMAWADEAATILEAAIEAPTPKEQT